LIELAAVVECTPEVNLDRGDDVERRDVEVNDDGKRHDLLVGREVGDGIVDRNTEKGERLWVEGEG